MKLPTYGDVQDMGATRYVLLPFALLAIAIWVLLDIAMWAAEL
jgi:hypothetical protein